MYGLVNKAIEDLVVTQFGPDKWLQIKRKANIQAETFAIMESYPDEVTYDLVGAASQVLKTPSNELLRAFGHFWIRYSSQEGYGSLLSMTGPTLFDSLQKLDQLHARLSISFPHLRPPSFRCTNITENSMRLHYHSQRPGLTHFVAGLIEGLAENFDQSALVEVDKTKDNGHSHDEFIITLKGSGQ